MSGIVFSVPSPPSHRDAAASANAASASAIGTTSTPKAAPPVQPTTLSYASATRQQPGPPAIASSSPPVVVGGSQPARHAGQKSSNSPLNGMSSSAPPVNPPGPPQIARSAPIANGNSIQLDHTRKSSVTIAASQGYPNGGVTNSSRASIQFGSMNPSGSPAISKSVPHNPHSLTAPTANPRVSSPAHSPSPVLVPASSGGKPPSMGPQGMSVAFGATGGDSNDSNMRAVSMPQGPVAGLAPQHAHMRRESSQSSHSDMSGHQMNRQFSAGNNRQRPFPPGYAPNMGAPSPVPSYRQPYPGQRPPNMPPFQQQGPIRMPQSPYLDNASPAMRPVQMHQPPQMPNGAMVYGQYAAQHQLHPTPVNPPLSSRNTSGSADSTAFNATASDKQNFPPSTFLHQPFYSAAQPLTHQPAAFHTSTNFAMISPSMRPENGGFDQYLTIVQHQPMYGMPQQYDPNYAQYYPHPQPPYMPGMQYHPPASPRPQYTGPHIQGNPYGHGPYQPPMTAHGMVPSGSQGPERPSSAISQPATPAMSSAVNHTPSQSNASPAPATPNSNFKIPTKAKSKVVIKNPKGEEITFGAKDKSASPVPSVTAQPQPPPVVSSTPTPPPKSITPQTQQVATSAPTQTSKTKEEIVAEFREKTLRSQQSDEPAKEGVAATEAEPVVEAPKTAAVPEATKEEPVANTVIPKAEHAKSNTLAAEADEGRAARDKKQADDDFEKMIAELEAKEKEEEERQRAYDAKKKIEAEAKKKRDEETNADELKRQEAEAERVEEERAKARAAKEAGNAPANDADKKMFASLKKPSFGPGAMAASTEGSGANGASTPASASEMAAPPPIQERAPSPQIKTPSSIRNKPTALKLETHKPVEPAQPTAGMNSLKSARFLAVQEAIKYPEGISSPNPAMNASAKGNGRQYDVKFLLQFQQCFKEKPSVDWDRKVRETVGDGSGDSARPPSARTPNVASRQPSRGGPSMAPQMQMGAFGGNFSTGRTLPPNTTSQERFKQSNVGGPPGIGAIGSFSRPAGFNQGVMMGRQPSQTGFQPARGPLDSPRTGSSRRGGGGGGGGGSRRANPREEAEKLAKMPLTAGQELKPLEMSQTGWKSTSVGVGPSTGLPGARLAPDMVQRKVKAALNKMTPEKFDKISEDILAIAAQSKDETDGRTLRQVIQLTFEKACDEAHWSSMYANFAKRMMDTMSQDIKDENIKNKDGKFVTGGALFRKYLLTRCQEEFERGWEVNLPESEGKDGEVVMLSDEYYVAAAAKRRGLGLIQFIGELFKFAMLTPRIMHVCVMKLLNFEGEADEAAIESLVKLLRTIGAHMDAYDQQALVRVYFERIEKILAQPALPSRLRFMLLDVIDLRKAGWRSKDDAKGPKTITEIHAEAAAAQQAAELERQRVNQRGQGGRVMGGRGDGRNFSSGGHMPPPDYNKNHVNMDDLKKLTGRGSLGRGTNSGVGFGPGSSLLSGSRSNSGRKGLGPTRMGDDAHGSGMTSRTGTPPAEKKEATTSMNAFSALAGLDSGEGADEVASPPSAKSSPPVAKTTPADTAHTQSKSPLGDKETADAAVKP